MKIKENPPETLRTARQFLTLQKFLQTTVVALGVLASGLSAQNRASAAETRDDEVHTVAAASRSAREINWGAPTTKTKRHDEKVLFLCFGEGPEKSICEWVIGPRPQEGYWKTILTPGTVPPRVIVLPRVIRTPVADLGTSQLGVRLSVDGGLTKQDPQ